MHVHVGYTLTPRIALGRFFTLIVDLYFCDCKVYRAAGRFLLKPTHHKITGCLEHALDLWVMVCSLIQQQLTVSRLRVYCAQLAAVKTDTRYKLPKPHAVTCSCRGDLRRLLPFPTPTLMMMASLLCHLHFWTLKALSPRTGTGIKSQLWPSSNSTAEHA